MFYVTNYKSVLQVRNIKNKDDTGGGLCSFLHNLLTFTTQIAPNKNTKNIELLLAENDK